MKNTHCPHTIRYLLLIFGACFVFRAAEYMLLRTDQGILGEAFVHKLIGILILSAAARHWSLTWKQIGFVRRGAGKQILCGLLLGGAAYVFAYSVEFFVQLSRGGNPSFQLYAAGHAANGSLSIQTARLFLAICIAGNLINVVMEEGVFRGLFVKLMESRHTFIRAAVFSSCLFGLWHIAAPVRALLDGEMGASAAILYACGYALLSGLVGFKLCLLVRITGSLWMPMADHFVNNTIINILHITTATGADELQIPRVCAAQAVSGLIVLWLYRKSGASAKPACRLEPISANNSIYRKGDPL